MRLEATTRFGRVRGESLGGVLAFRGIPYAAPPVGERRFRGPEPPEPWTGVREASAFGPAAPQQLPPGLAIWPGLDPGPQDEDCLYLNVYTPAQDDARRPVLVWIHGGGFDFGAASQPYFQGGKLAERGDVVVVTFNYRLGALGFCFLDELASGDLDVEANPGLRDQIAALEWVQENVAAFGGDPGNVTLFGESAGAISIAILMGLPRTKGLLHRAVAQSGSLQPLHPRECASEIARGLLHELGLREREAGLLREHEATQILAAQRRLIGRLGGSPESLLFRPVIDGGLVPDAPIEALRRGEAKDIPLLVGTNRDECRPFVLADPRARDLDEAAIVDGIRERAPESDIARLQAAYGVDPAGADLVSVATAIATDHHFRLPAIRMAEAQSRHQSDTFMYLFDWESPGFGGALGACHGIEVPFLFATLDQPGVDQFAGSGEDARCLSQRMMAAWIAFARTGRPSVPELPDWPPFEPGRRATMRLDRACRVELDPEGEQRSAWDPPEMRLALPDDE